MSVCRSTACARSWRRRHQASETYSSRSNEGERTMSNENADHLRLTAVHPPADPDVKRQLPTTTNVHLSVRLFYASHR
ncbi:hypothetical protein EVAR_26454_1 [Eumeta japonica]|uniref:Uncharacterized protein n=1 Tax=Eumeta variegata TaxID=151549 RepID=A0A4C1VRI6_EUMVA|nr:hypothetical protein EVAR_26454_1 [Eumeta japonica]